jgi:hypothetical protein
VSLALAENRIGVAVLSEKGDAAMDIQVIERRSQQVVAIYPVELKGQNYSPQESEYFDLAWQCAVDDGIAKITNRDAYEFRALSVG